MDNCRLPGGIFEALRDLSIFLHINLTEARWSDYEFAVKEIRKAAILMANAGPRPEIGMLLFFPYTISETIVSDIQAMDPFAVILLSYFTLLLKAMEPTFWFMQGWSKRLFETVERRLRDDSRWWDIAKWPMDQAANL